MHYAIHGHTAAEHILERADHQKQNMGLMTWQDAPDGKIKGDVIAKLFIWFELSQQSWLSADFAENMIKSLH
ncbi:RhuM family protein [Faecalibacillus intestinalis]|uniref:RhuM family protein n=1 Tax=Faecalibacillus intestinalis TaxID=1982626 RepID=UPI003994052E